MFSWLGSAQWVQYVRNRGTRYRVSPEKSFLIYVDALILQRSGHVRVTAVARSNFDAIQGQLVNFQQRFIG